MRLTNKEIFEKKIFEIPNQRNGKEFLSFINETLGIYRKELDSFNKELRSKLNPFLPIIDFQISSLIRVIELYFKGLTKDSYIQLSNCLNKLSSEGLLPIQAANTIRANNTLFRIRESTNYTLSKKEVFHIPFQLREIVNTQRFSIPGFPCLYLGDSVYVCWEELNRPSFENIQVSRFSIEDSNFNFLLLNAATNDFRMKCFKSNNDGNFLGMLTGFLTFWPTLFCCSIKVDKPNKTFKPEYIIPQLVLQWIVSEKKLDGIIYKSNKVSIQNAKYNIGSFSNFVIPIKQNNSSGYCSELINKLKFTNPISFNLMDIAGHSNNLNKVFQTDTQLKSAIGRVAYIELITGEKTDYSKTKFGLLENKLKVMNATKLL